MYATRTSNNLKDLDKPDASVIKLQAAIDDFDRCLDSLDEIQTAVEVETDPENLEEELDVAFEFRREVCRPRVQAMQRLKELMKSEKADPSASSLGMRKMSVCVKYPKLELPKFKGDVTQWQSFWELFVTYVHDSDCPVEHKFIYLQMSLEGKAKSVIKGLALTEANYQVACDLLKERFGRPKLRIFAHMMAILNCNIPVKSRGPKYVSSLWYLHNELLSHISSLKELGVSGHLYELILTHVVLSRLPHELRMECAREVDGLESNISWIFHFFRRQIERIEISETFKNV